MKINRNPLIPPPKGYKCYLINRETAIGKDGKRRTVYEVNILVKKTIWERYEPWLIAAGFLLLGVYKVWVGDWQF